MRGPATVREPTTVRGSAAVHRARPPRSPRPPGPDPRPEPGHPGGPRVRFRLAEALLASGADDGGRERATELLRLAGTVAEHLGARPLARSVTLLAQRARLLLHPVPRQRGAVSADPADPADALGLTGRERDVLRLVAAGHTNRRIAETLFISPKTASVHVSNILAKLGVSGRGEAAAVAHRLGLFPAEAEAG